MKTMVKMKPSMIKKRTKSRSNIFPWEVFTAANLNGHHGDLHSTVLIAVSIVRIVIISDPRLSSCSWRASFSCRGLGVTTLSTFGVISLWLFWSHADRSFEILGVMRSTISCCNGGSAQGVLSFAKASAIPTCRTVIATQIKALRRARVHRTSGSSTELLLAGN